MTTKILSPIFITIAIIAWMMLGATVPSCENDSKKPHETNLPAVPTEATFCGEQLPLSRTDIYESLDREILSNTFWHTNTLLVLKRAGRIFPVVEPILREMGMPDDLKYLCVAESNLLPTTKSPAGAVGLWQFMEATAKEYGLKVNDEIDERCDIEKSTRAACRMLRHNYAQLGSWALVAASYNGGLSRVKKIVETQHQNNYFDIHWAEETGRYVFRIVALKTIMTSPESYGFALDEQDIYKPYDYKTVSVAGPIEDIPQWAIDHGTTYKRIRLLNPWLLKPKVTTKDTLQIRY